MSTGTLESGFDRAQVPDCGCPAIRIACPHGAEGGTPARRTGPLPPDRLYGSGATGLLLIASLRCFRDPKNSPRISRPLLSRITREPPTGSSKEIRLASMPV